MVVVPSLTSMLLVIGIALAITVVASALVGVLTSRVRPRPARVVTLPVSRRAEAPQELRRAG